MDTPDPYLMALADQYEMKFRHLSQKLTQLLSDAPRRFDEDSFRQFRDTLHETLGDDEQEMLSFVSFLLSEVAKSHHKLMELAEALAQIQGITINMMRPSQTRDVMMQAVIDYREKTEAEEALFSDITDQPKPRETFTTGTGQVLQGVHRADECIGACVIHRPVSGPWDDWPTHYIEEIGVMYRICPHGKYHPALEDWLRKPHVVAAHDCDDCQCGPTMVEGLFKKMGDTDGAGT